MPLKKENGFTLLELLIGMLLLTFGLLSAIILETTCIRSNSMAVSMDQATNLAQFQLETLCNNPNPAGLINGKQSVNSAGEIDAKGPYTLTWTINVGPTASTRRVRVEATWNNGIGNRLVALQDIAAGSVR